MSGAGLKLCRTSLLAHIMAVWNGPGSFGGSAMMISARLVEWTLFASSVSYDSV